MVRIVRPAASVNPNNFRFSAMARRALMMPMRLAWMIGMICSLASWAAAPAVPAQYGWQRNAMYVYRVNIESAEEGYQPSLRGDVVYLCRASNPHGFTLRCYNFAVLQRHAKNREAPLCRSSPTRLPVSLLGKTDDRKKDRCC